MKSPRFLAALAMAAVLTTGVTAHAATGADVFKPVSGNAANGQTPMKQADVFKDEAKFNTDGKIEAEGDITVDGMFTKRINNLPTPTHDGHYLRVTMPIKTDYTYDVDTNTLVSTDMVITNNSVYATQTGNGTPNPLVKPNLEYKKVKVSLVDFQDNKKGTTTTTSPVMFVKNVNAHSNVTDKVLLPFEFRITSPTGFVDDYSIEAIQDKTAQNQTNGISAIEIDKNSTLTLKLQQISGQSIGNKDLIKQHTSKVSHSLKLKFEYDGN